MEQSINHSFYHNTKILFVYYIKIIAELDDVWLINSSGREVALVVVLCSEIATTVSSSVISHFKSYPHIVPLIHLLYFELLLASLPVCQYRDYHPYLLLRCLFWIEHYEFFTKCSICGSNHRCSHCQYDSSSCCCHYFVNVLICYGSIVQLQLSVIRSLWHT